MTNAFKNSLIFILALALMVSLLIAELQRQLIEKQSSLIHEQKLTYKKALLSKEKELSDMHIMLAASLDKKPN